MQCQTCHQREATYQITTVENGLLATNDLCAWCYHFDSAGRGEPSATPPEAYCEYCGAPLSTGGTDWLAMVTGTGTPETKFMCMPCAFEYNRFLRHNSLQNPPGPSDQKPSDWFRQIRQKADEQTKFWIKQRAV